MQKLLYVLLIFLTVLGCKESHRDEDVLTNTSEENAFAEAIFADVFKMVHFAAMNNKGISNATNSITSIYGCDDIVVDTSTTPRNFFIDFKFTGCVPTNGIPRKGRIISEFTGIYPDSTSIANILFLNYSFGEYLINGNLIVVNRGRNANGNTYLTFFVQDGVIANERSSFTWEANRSWELVGGASTPDLGDDIYHITGTTFGTNRNGNAFDTEVQKANKMLNNCLHFTEGMVDVNVKNLSLRKLNYGSGKCDNAATLTINGKDRQITLPR